MSITVKAGWAVEVSDGSNLGEKIVTIKRQNDGEYVVHSVYHFAAYSDADPIALTYDVFPAAFDKD